LLVVIIPMFIFPFEIIKFKKEKRKNIYNNKTKKGKIKRIKKHQI
jgi:hypothetical protein